MFLSWFPFGPHCSSFWNPMFTTWSSDSRQIPYFVGNSNLNLCRMNSPSFFLLRINVDVSFIKCHVEISDEIISSPDLCGGRGVHRIQITTEARSNMWHFGSFYGQNVDTRWIYSFEMLENRSMVWYSWPMTFWIKEWIYHCRKSGTGFMANHRSIQGDQTLGALETVWTPWLVNAQLSENQAISQQDKGLPTLRKSGPWIWVFNPTNFQNLWSQALYPGFHTRNKLFTDVHIPWTIPIYHHSPMRLSVVTISL